MNSTDNTHKTGKTMALIAWIVGILILTQLFGVWERDQINPNRSPESTSSNGSVTVTLEQNRKGHYLVTGSLNQKPARFLLDTGATDVVVPADKADYYNLEVLGRGTGITAGGPVMLEKTVLDEIRIGGITLYNVRASINPGMTSRQPILLGMSALRQLELNQKSGVLKLTQHNRS